MAKNAGLTRDEIKKLTDTTVTWGDVFASTMDVILERGGVSAQGVKSAWEVALQGVMDFGKFSVAMLLAGFAGLVRGVGSAFVNLGKLVANAIGGAANAVIAGIEAMLNKAIDAVNTMATKANSVINLLPEPIRKALGIGNFGQADHASLGRVPVGGFDLSNPLADALGQVHSTFDDVMGGFDAISSRASGRRDARVGSQINDILLDRKGKGGSKGAANDNAAKALDDQTKAYEQALKAGQAFEAQIQTETDSIGQDAIAQKRMEVATEAATLRKMAATAPTQALKDALNQEADAVLAAGAAWEKVTKEQATADFIKNTIEPLERQVSLLGLSAEAQARANLEAEKGAVIAKAGAAAWERYYAAQSAIITDQFKAKNPLQEWLESVPHTAAQVANSLQQIAVKGFDSLASGITEVIMGTKSLGAAFKDIARSIIADIIQMTIRMLIFKAISGLFGGGAGGSAPSGGFAKGGVFSGGNVVPFAVGGIVSGPTLFPMSGGRTGLMGEAGPEAVMPLARDSQGRLGVRAGNDNTQRVVVELTLDNELLGARIVEGANAFVEIKRPGIVSQSVNATMRTANRPVLMGRR
jgi:lambda family phage tail tape measure protein